MKNRIISLVLLVAMVVTALPLVAFPVIAAEAPEKTYTAEEYDALYVQDGLVFAMDFFKTNSYWNVDGTAFSVPVGPSLMTAYEYGGKTYNFKDNEADRLCYRIVEYKVKTVSGNAATAWDYAWVEAMSGEYATEAEAQAALDAALAAGTIAPLTQNEGAVTKGDIEYKVCKRLTNAFREALADANGWQAQDKAFYAQFKTGGNSTIYMHSYVAMPGAADLYGIDPTTATKSITPVEIGDGYLNILSTHTSGTLQLANQASAASSAMSQQIIGATGPNFQSKFTIFMNLRPDIAADDAGNYRISGITNFSNVTLTHEELTIKKSDTEVVDITLSLANIAAGATGTMTGRTEDGLLFTATGTYPSSLNHSYYLGWSNTMVGSKLYAYRQYASVLSQAEIEQNHFADLAKFFRLDLSSYLLLSDAGKAKVNKVAVPYSMDGDRATIAAALEGAATAELTAEYTSLYGDKLDAEIIAVAAEYLLDLSLIDGISRGVLSNTYKLLLGDLSEVADVPAAYAAAVKADIAAYTAAGSQNSAMVYNALYVTEGLKYAIDFFATNEYWGTAGVTYDGTNAADYTAMLAAAEWFVTSASLTYGKPSATNKITVANGFMDSSAYTNFILTGHEKFSAFNNVTAEYLMQVVKGGSSSEYGIMVNNQRLYLNPVTGELKRLEIQSNLFRAFNAIPTYNGKNVALDSVFAPTTFAYGVSFEPTVSAKWAAEWWDEDPAIDDGNIRIAKYIEVDGERVLSVSNEKFVPDAVDKNGKPTPNKYSKFFWPVAPQKVSAQYIDGAKQDAAAEYLVVFEEDRVIPADITILENGTVKYAAEVPFLNNSLGYNSTYWNWSAVRNNVYAARYYEGVLTAEENAQNHFADIAKWYRLNLSGFSALNETQKATVYAAFGEVGLDATREEAQSVLLRAMAPYVKEAYEALKGEDARINALIDLGYEYSLELDALLEADFDLTFVFETVTAAALAGKTSAEAQAILNSALYAAQHYASRYADDALGNWNALIDYAIEKLTPTEALDIEKLVLLPWSVRSRFTFDAEKPLAEVQAAIDAFYAEKIVAFAATENGDFDYDSLYVKEGLIFAADFFKTNAYWADGTTYAAPVGPSDNTAYEYEGKTYNFKDNETDRLCYRLVKDKKYLTEDMYKTEAEAQAALAALADSTGVTVLEAATPAFIAAVAEWVTADKATLAQFVTYAEKAENGNAIYPFSYVPTFGADKSASYNRASGIVTKSFSAFEIGNGYITIRPGQHDSGGLQFANLNYFDTPYTTQQAVFAAGENFKNIFTIFGDIRPQAVQQPGGAVITLLNKNSTSFVVGEDPSGNPMASFAVNSIPLTLTDVTDYTMTLYRTEEEDGDSVTAYSQDGLLFSAQGTYGKDSLNNTCYIGYGNSTAGTRLYAYRTYTKALSDAERLQNHFADLAKFYRLDVSYFDQLGADDKAALYAAFLPYELGTADKAELQALYNSFLSDIYDGVTVVENEALNADFLKLAKAGLLDLGAILALDETNAGNVAVDLLAEFPDATVSIDVVRTVYAALIAKCKAISFVGYQVRLDTGVAAFNYAGLRAVFDIDMEALEAIAKIYRDTDVTAMFGISGMGDSKSTIIALQFSYNEETGEVDVVGSRVEGGVAVPYEVKTYERVLADGTTVTSLNLTLTFKGDSFTKENLTNGVIFLAAAGIVHEDGENICSATRVSCENENFSDDHVSAAHVYYYFSSVAGYDEDAMVKKVIETVGMDNFK